MAETAAESGVATTGGWRRHLPFVVLGLVLAVLFAHLVIQDLSHSLIATGDVNLWSYQGYYVATNLRLLPVPHLDLDNDVSFYPYGTSQVFQPWGFERELFWAACYALLGHGPWLQLYFLLSTLITLFGCYVLLVREHGRLAAGAVGLLVAFANYGAIWRFPGQINMACLHWAVLGLVADYLLARRLWLGERWTTRLLLARGALLVLALGLDLGYVAGISLTSFALTITWATLVFYARRRPRPRELAAIVKSWRSQLAAGWRDAAESCAALVALAAVAAFFFVPLAAQSALAARAFDFSDFIDHAWWAHPLRLFIPVLPWLNPLQFPTLRGDSPEGAFVTSPGWFFLLIGVLGAVLGRRRWGAYVPLLVLMLLFLTYHGHHVPYLRMFPWFGFIRVGGRFSVVFPTILALIGLAIPATFWRARAGRVAAVLAGLLLAVEVTTAYRFALAMPKPYVRPGPSFAGLMATIAATPGEAVLEWPFCVAAGNGLGTGELCLYYHQQSGLFAFRQFHHKKVVGQYFGRLHRSQLTPFRQAGWPQMFFPDVDHPMLATRQRRDFLPGEWRFLADFYRLNDFCGLLIYPDLLAPETVRTIHEFAGPPVAETTYPGVGRMQFIPKSAAWRSGVDPARGRAVRLLPDDLVVALDLDLTGHAADRFLTSGWGGPDGRFRWTEARAATVEFASDRIAPLLVELTMSSFRAQRIRVALNGHPLGEVASDGGPLRDHTWTAPTEIVAHSNRLTLELPDACTPASVGAGNDIRLLGASVSRIRVRRIESAPAGR
jgi:hypothetical protein